MFKSLMYGVLICASLILASCSEKESPIFNQNQDLALVVEKVSSLQLAMAKNLILKSVAQRDREDIERLLVLIKIDSLRLQKDSNDQNALVNFVRHLKELSIMEMLSQDKAIFQPLLDSANLAAFKLSKTQNADVGLISWRMFSYKFNDGLYPFGSFATLTPWTTTWSLDRSYATINGSGNNAWLISPNFNFSGLEKPSFRIRHSININRNGRNPNEPFDIPTILNTVFKVKVSNQYDGGDPNANPAIWREYRFSSMPSGTDFHTVTSPEVDLAEFAGNKRVTIALEFDTTEIEKIGSHYITWSVEDFELLGLGQLSSFEPRPGKLLEWDFTRPSLDPFKQYNSIDGSALWEAFGFNGKFKFAKISSNGKDTKSWLISPRTKLSGLVDTVLHVHQVVRNPIWHKLGLMISTDYVSGDPEKATWQQYEFSDPEGEAAGRYKNKWGDVPIVSIPMDKYNGQTIAVAFVFEATASERHDWEVLKLSFWGKNGLVKEVSR